MAKPLEKEFDYYLENQAALAAKYDGRYIVIKDSQVLGDYDSDLQAIEQTSKKHEIGTFLVQRCCGDKEDYTVHFHSRVAFM